ncbi:MAG: glycosyltransferase family 2 protein [Coriobacteriia bacterium]|nr:glycosyltransferase family 2 protein [Coriobacteriia bacterium]
MNKILSFAIPCYNSAEYMDKCISSILEGANYAEDIEIIIVNDGSTKDNTKEKADAWAAQYPNLIRAHHQENGGHGTGVMAGIRLGQGMYYKVVDSDDWVDGPSVQKLLEFLRSQAELENPVDLVITNYVYEHVEDDEQMQMKYTNALPVEQITDWDHISGFRINETLLMHALCYRMEVLRESKLSLPKHTFYVDNIFAYVPLPYVKSLYYINTDLYRYFIGREDQSVNEKVMIGRIDQQLRVTRIMTEAYHIYDDIDSKYLVKYMENYLSLMYAISSIFSKMSEDPDADNNLEILWKFLKNFDKKMYNKMKHSLVGFGTNLPGPLGTKMSLGFYRIAQKIFKFN